MRFKITLWSLSFLLFVTLVSAWVNPKPCGNNPVDGCFATSDITLTYGQYYYLTTGFSMFREYTLNCNGGRLVGNGTTKIWIYPNLNPNSTGGGIMNCALWGIGTVSAGTYDRDKDGYTVFDDCDEISNLTNPGMNETPYNGVDEDCSISTQDDDLDSDGYNLSSDCNDTDAWVNPGAAEIMLNGKDDDCNESTTDTPSCLSQTQCNESIVINGIIHWCRLIGGEWKWLPCAKCNGYGCGNISGAVNLPLGTIAYCNGYESLCADTNRWEKCAENKLKNVTYANGSLRFCGIGGPSVYRWYAKDGLCNDSDSGRVYFTYGSTRSTDFNTGGYLTMFDQCYAGYLYERYCADMFEQATETYRCVYGCSNGTCIRPSCNATTLCNATFIEDGVMKWCRNMNNAGYNWTPCAKCNGAGCSGSSIEYFSGAIGECESNSYLCTDNKKWERCSGTNICQNANANGKNYTCHLGGWYQNDCYDSDNGSTYYTKGYTYNPDDFFGEYNITDRCIGSLLKEAVCRCDDHTRIDYTCPYGCSDGACVKPSCSNATQCSTTFNEDGVMKWCRNMNNQGWNWSICGKCGTNTLCESKGYPFQTYLANATAKCSGVQYVCRNNNWVLT